MLFLGLAAPGFFAVFSTSLHQNLFVAVAGLFLFAAAVAFRLRSEPLFETASGSASSNPKSSNPTLKETPDA